MFPKLLKYSFEKISVQEYAAGGCCLYRTTRRVYCWLRTAIFTGICLGAISLSLWAGYRSFVFLISV